MERCFRCAIAMGLCAVVLVSAQTGDKSSQDLGIASTTGIVVSSSDLASDAGSSILHQGGNAVDAAMATAFALAVTFPGAGNIGGGGFMIVRDPSGRGAAIDYREKAPLMDKPGMYLDEQGKIIRKLTDEGYLAPGVPGTVLGLELAHKRYGKLPWNECG
jgi:gamma-glutamyltranspeptidase/glutathione hydrolase